jgi:hypothetical protein
MLTLLVFSLLSVGDDWAPLPPPATGAALKPDLSPRARYEAATRYIAGGKPGEASAILDLLIAEFPRVPEYFAARAQAQLALRAPLYASADAQYALALKPELASTHYTLAAAEEALGHAGNAALHYRLFADSASDVRQDTRAEARARANRLAPPQQPIAPAPSAPVYAAPPPAAPAPSCRMGSNGQQACGYNCRMGSDGIMACADTPDGVCALGSDGRVTCSQLRSGGGTPGGPPPECRMGSDGQQTCGYNCRMGSNGRMYCASRPDGQCAFNSNGTFTCP